MNDHSKHPDQLKAFFRAHTLQMRDEVTRELNDLIRLSAEEAARYEQLKKDLAEMEAELAPEDLAAFRRALEGCSKSCEGLEQSMQSKRELLRILEEDLTIGYLAGSGRPPPL